MPPIISSLSVSEVSSAVVSWIEEQGELGPVYYTVFLAVWVILLMPCTILEVVPGFLFGFKTGWIVSIIGKSLGSYISLILGRYFLKERINNYFFSSEKQGNEKAKEKYKILKAMKRAVELEGFKVVLMIRVAYLPMLIKNYGLSVLDVSIFQVTLASVLAGIPFSAAWAAIGASSKSIAEIFEGKLTVLDAMPLLSNLSYSECMAYGTMCLSGTGMFFYGLMKFGARFKEILSNVTDEKSNFKKDN